MEIKISKWGTLKVTRENVEFEHVHGIDIDKDTLLGQILPFGSPTGEAVKYIVIDDTAYLTYIQMNHEEGHGIVVVFEDPEDIDPNILGLVASMKSLLEKGVEQDSLKLNLQPIQREILDLENLDVGIYSNLARIPTLVLGSNEQVTNLINVILHSIPKEMCKRFFFVTQSQSLSENVKLIGMPPTNEVIKEIENNAGEQTIVTLRDKVVYGQYSSKMCKELAALLKKERYDEVRQRLDDFYDIVTESSDLSKKPLEFSKDKQLHLSDAELALRMRKNYFNL